MPIFLRPDTPGFEAAFEAFAAARRETTDDVSEVVKGIIADIRARGDVALAELTRRFDQAAVEPGAFRVSAEEIAGARRACASDTLEALDFAARRIEAFHRAQLPADLSLVDDAGVALGMRWRPIDSVGLYVPGGQAAYPSSVLMNANPGKRGRGPAPGDDGSRNRWHAQSSGPCRCRPGECQRDLPDWRGPGNCGARLRYRVNSGG